MGAANATSSQPGQGRALHHHEAGLLQMPDQPLCGDPAHGQVGIVDPLSAIIAERKSKRLCNLVSGRWANREVDCHTWNANRQMENFPRTLSHAAAILAARSARKALPCWVLLRELYSADRAVLSHLVPCPEFGSIRSPAPRQRR